VTPFFTALMGAVPPSVLDVVDPERLRWAQDRLDAAAAHVVECERRHGNGAVAPRPRRIWVVGGGGAVGSAIPIPYPRNGE